MWKLSLLKRKCSILFMMAWTFQCFTYSYRNTAFSQAKLTFSKCYFIKLCVKHGKVYAIAYAIMNSMEHLRCNKDNFYILVFYNCYFIKEIEHIFSRVPIRHCTLVEVWENSIEIAWKHSPYGLLFPLLYQSVNLFMFYIQFYKITFWNFLNANTIVTSQHISQSYFIEEI